MEKGRRIAAAALIALALTGAAAAGAQTQTQDPPAGTVGNPQLKNFELPGRTTVPAPETAPAPAPATTPPPATTQPQAEVSAPEAATPAPAGPAPEAREVRRAPARETAAPEPAPAPAEPVVPTPSQLEQALPAPVAEAPVPTPPPTAEAPVPVAEESSQGFPWIYAGFALLLGLLAFGGYRKFRGSAEETAEEVPAPEPAPEPRPQPVAAPRPAPAPAPQPAAAPAPDGGLVGIQMRPWLELEFRPERAVATLTEASVQFELVIRNRGNAPARNIRIEARMFNAGPEQEQEIGAFYAEPIRERTPPSVPLIPPRDQVQFRTAVTMPKELVREVTVAGRRLFIPTVAFNVVYDWGANKSGQTSMSYVVGREAETPTEKMGAFRLDLGPRLYRSVGQRQTKLARIV